MLGLPAGLESTDMQRKWPFPLHMPEDVYTYASERDHIRSDVYPFPGFRVHVVIRVELP